MIFYVCQYVVSVCAIFFLVSMWAFGFIDMNATRFVRSRVVVVYVLFGVFMFVFGCVWMVRVRSYVCV